jgi:hypothetical protein
MIGDLFDAPLARRVVYHQDAIVSSGVDIDAIKTHRVSYDGPALLQFPHDATREKASAAKNGIGILGDSNKLVFIGASSFNGLDLKLVTDKHLLLRPHRRTTDLT